MKTLALIGSLLLVLSAGWSGVTAQDTSDGTSRDTPYPFGESATVGGFDLRVVDVIPDATSIVLEAGQHNDPPGPGYVFSMARVEATYVGEGSGHAWHGLLYNVVGAGNLGYSDRDADCGTFPDRGIDTPEVFPGGKIEFNVCWRVPEDEVGSLVMYVDPNRLFNDERVWLSLEQEATATPAA
jgi:hypothetical protein